MDEPIVDENTIDLSSGVESDSITIDTSSMNSYNYSYSTIPSSITISNSSSSNYGAVGSSGSFITSVINVTSWSNVNWNTSSNPRSLNVKGDAEFDGDVKIKGVSIAKTLEAINERLAILHPDPAKLEHFAALKKAYEHYKTLEALCEIPKEESRD
jgi:hypothetical protein